jgi:hypothetical protein
MALLKAVRNQQTPIVEERKLAISAGVTALVDSIRVEVEHSVLNQGRHHSFFNPKGEGQ